MEKETPGGPETWFLRTDRCSVAAASASALGCERVELHFSRVSVDAASLPHRVMPNVFLYFGLGNSMTPRRIVPSLGGVALGGVRITRCVLRGASLSRH